MSKPRWTLLALATLGGTAAADPGDPAQPARAAESFSAVSASGTSYRGASENYLVMPSGGELGGDWRFITSDDTPLRHEPLKFTDMVLFDLAARWSLLSRLELSANVAFLPKQPAYTDEKAWQSVNFALRSPLGKQVAIAISGGGGHLLAHQGAWTRESLMVQFRKPIDREFLSFDVAGGLDGMELQAPNAPSAYLVEFAFSTSAVFHSGRCGCFGAWVGVAYAAPVQHSGSDPTTDVPIDPRSRVDFHIGAVITPVKQWDLYVDAAIINRGDSSHPATQLPILDGGFSQQQIVLGVTRHFSGPRHRHHDNDDDAMRLSRAE